MLYNKRVIDKQLSRSSRLNIMHCVQKKITSLKHGSHEYQRIQMKIIDAITSRILLIFPEISGKFLEILNFRKTYNTTPHRPHGEPPLTKLRGTDGSLRTYDSTAALKSRALLCGYDQYHSQINRCRNKNIKIVAITIQKIFATAQLLDKLWKWLSVTLQQVH